MEWLNGMTKSAKGILILMAIIAPIASASVAFGGWLATRTTQAQIAAMVNHIENPELHVVTRRELDRINRRLCKLMEAQGVADADCP